MKAALWVDDHVNSFLDYHVEHLMTVPSLSLDTAEIIPDALQRLASRKYDLLILDSEIPEGFRPRLPEDYPEGEMSSGARLFEYLRRGRVLQALTASECTARDVPVLFFTVGILAEVHLAPFSRGGRVEFLNKMAPLEVFIALVTDMLGITESGG